MWVQRCKRVSKGPLFSKTPVEEPKGSPFAAQEPGHRHEAGEAQPPSSAPAGMSSTCVDFCRFKGMWSYMNVNIYICRVCVRKYAFALGIETQGKNYFTSGDPHHGIYALY